MRKFKTLKLSDKIRLVIDDTAQCLTVKQALDQFLDGGLVNDLLTRFDIERQQNKDTTGLAGRFNNKNMQIDLY